MAEGLLLQEAEEHQEKNDRDGRDAYWSLLQQMGNPQRLEKVLRESPCVQADRGQTLTLRTRSFVEYQKCEIVKYIKCI